MAIRRLTPLLVSQIAAGEVIERPASVAKELVENSLDAGAHRVDILVEEGGRELVRVSDDGRGIAAAELPLAIAAHATSKITDVDDLGAIATMGFRGEALASILSVSRLRLSSRVAESAEGAMIEGSGDQCSDPRPIGCAPGTVVEVRNLFFNTPARRKFMRAASTEFGHVTDTFTRLAMAHPAVGFKLAHGERVTCDLPPGQTPAQRCLALLGNDVAEGMLEFDSDERGVKLWGLAGLPSLARATGKYQYIYVNGRPIRDRNVLHAIREAYRGLMDGGLQPMIVLFITLAADQVDVNVHPTKAEVRFADSNSVHGQVLATVRQRLLETDLVPTVRPPGMASAPGPMRINPDDLLLGSSAAASGTAIPSTQDFVDYFRRMDAQQKHLVYEEVRREVRPDSNGHDEPRPNLPSFRPSDSVLQVHNSYIVTQDDHGIIIIDQHALHERVMFESLIERVRSAGSLESQRLITPAVVRASESRLESLEKVQPLLTKIGIEAQPLGPGTIGIHAFPTLLFDRHVDPAEFLDHLLDRADEEGFNPSDEAALHVTLDMMSCKAAVKAGDHLQPEELAALLERREQIDRSASCPHGRPTAIRLTLRDLEKHFKRV